MPRQELIDNVKGMRTFGTTGPLMQLRVLGDGEVPNSAGNVLSTPGATVTATDNAALLAVKMRAAPWAPVQESRIFVNGVQTI